ncbi:MAG: type II toxin-antitoxin system VapC family toxin [bacterium]|nr:type II toxin-antitoxin system VapC family toxin [bacterium]
MIAGVIDTHAIIWHIYADKRLSATALAFLNNAASQSNQIAISSISFIEIVYLIEKGRIPAETFTRIANKLVSPKPAFVEFAVDLSIARSLSNVSSAQIPDMPDRIIAAAALSLNVPLISRDGKIQLSTLTTIW